jgi:hypothetical protein
MQRGANVARSRCEFHNFFWPRAGYDSGQLRTLARRANVLGGLAIGKMQSTLEHVSKAGVIGADYAAEN